MTDSRTIQFTFAVDDPELDDERRLKIASKLLRELRDLDEVEKVDRAEDFNPEAGSKPGFATLIGVLTAQVGDKEVSIKAKSRQELLESEKIAKDLLAAMGGNNG
jgi:hypothetical protein